MAEVEPGELGVLQPDIDIAATLAADVEQAEADELADDGGPACTGNAHLADKHQQGIQRNVDDGAGDDANHGVAGAALEAELIIEHQ